MKKQKIFHVSTYLNEELCLKVGNNRTYLRYELLPKNQKRLHAAPYYNCQSCLKKKLTLAFMFYIYVSFVLRQFNHTKSL